MAKFIHVFMVREMESENPSKKLFLPLRNQEALSFELVTVVQWRQVHSKALILKKHTIYINQEKVYITLDYTNILKTCQFHINTHNSIIVFFVSPF